MTDTSSERAIANRHFTTEDYASIQSFDDAVNLINDKLGGQVIDSGQLGDGFSVITNKDQLIGVPFVIMQGNRSEGDNGTFVSLRCVTEKGDKLVVNDGSTGICEQLLTLWEKNPETAGMPMMCRKGLRKSEYDHPTYGRAKTYYIDTSAK